MFEYICMSVIRIEVLCNICLFWDCICYNYFYSKYLRLYMNEYKGVLLGFVCFN